MKSERTLGLQWRQAYIYILVGAGSPLVALAVYQLGKYYGLDLYASMALGFGAGILVGLFGAVAGSLIARSVKLRLWEAGRMAGRIARGDFRVRVEVGLRDEVGWLEEQLNHMAGQLENAVGSLREMAEQNRRLGEEAGRGAALEERMRLARDLHDTVNQQLFVLAMRAAALKNRLEKDELEGDKTSGSRQLSAEMEKLEQLARQAHSQTRELILQIRPVTLENEGLGAALEEYVNKTAEREGWLVTTDIDPSVRPGGLIGESLFRIAQEALNNVSKHASAKKIAVRLAQVGQGIKMEINDDGSGFNPESRIRPTAVGLSGISERVKSIGGSLEIESAPCQGTMVAITVPEEGPDHNERGKQQ